MDVDKSTDVDGERTDDAVAVEGFATDRPAPQVAIKVGVPIFSVFVRDNLPALIRYGTALAGNPHDGADLVQIGLEKTGMHWERVGGTDHPLAYVKTVMANARISGWRRRKRESLLDRVPEGARMDEYPTEQADVWAAVAGLPQRQRAVIVLRYMEGHSEMEIANMLGISPGTVKSQASKAMSRLRLMMNAQSREVS